MQAQGRLLYSQLWPNQFYFSIDHTQGSENFLVDGLTCELANYDH